MALAALPGAAFAIDRPAMDSYQPYAGLQYGFRPDPPIQRGVEHKRPAIVMPTRRAPLIEYGSPDSSSARWYAYCPRDTRVLEPQGGDTSTGSGAERSCR